MRSQKHVKRTHRVRNLRNAAACKRKAYKKRLEAKHNWQVNTVFTEYRLISLNAPEAFHFKIKEPKQRTAEEIAERQRLREQKRLEKELAKQKASTSALPKLKKIKKEKKLSEQEVPKKAEAKPKKEKVKKSAADGDKREIANGVPPKSQKVDTNENKVNIELKPSDGIPPKQKKIKREENKIVSDQSIKNQISPVDQTQEDISPITKNKAPQAKAQEKAAKKEKAKITETSQIEERISTMDGSNKPSKKAKKEISRPVEEKPELVGPEHLPQDEFLTKVEPTTVEDLQPQVVPEVLPQIDEKEQAIDLKNLLGTDILLEDKKENQPLFEPEDINVVGASAPLMEDIEQLQEKFHQDIIAELESKNMQQEEHHEPIKDENFLEESKPEEHFVPAEKIETSKGKKQKKQKGIHADVPHIEHDESAKDEGDAVKATIEEETAPKENTPPEEAPRKSKKKRNRKSDGEHHTAVSENLNVVEGEAVDVNANNEVENAGEFTQVITKRQKKKGRHPESENVHEVSQPAEMPEEETTDTSKLEEFVDVEGKAKITKREIQQTDETEKPISKEQQEEEPFELATQQNDFAEKQPPITEEQPHVIGEKPEAGTGEAMQEETHVAGEILEQEPPIAGELSQEEPHAAEEVPQEKPHVAEEVPEEKSQVTGEIPEEPHTVDELIQGKPHGPGEIPEEAPHVTEELPEEQPPAAGEMPEEPEMTVEVPQEQPHAVDEVPEEELHIAAEPLDEEPKIAGELPHEEPHAAGEVPEGTSELAGEPEAVELPEEPYTAYEIPEEELRAFGDLLAEKPHVAAEAPEEEPQVAGEQPEEKPTAFGEVSQEEFQPRGETLEELAHVASEVPKEQPQLDEVPGERPQLAEQISGEKSQITGELPEDYYTGREVPQQAEEPEVQPHVSGEVREYQPEITGELPHDEPYLTPEISEEKHLLVDEMFEESLLVGETSEQQLLTVGEVLEQEPSVTGEVTQEKQHVSFEEFEEEIRRAGETLQEEAQPTEREFKEQPQEAGEAPEEKPVATGEAPEEGSYITDEVPDEQLQVAAEVTKEQPQLGEVPEEKPQAVGEAYKEYLVAGEVAEEAQVVGEALEQELSSAGEVLQEKTDLTAGAFEKEPHITGEVPGQQLEIDAEILEQKPQFVDEVAEERPYAVGEASDEQLPVAAVEVPQEKAHDTIEAFEEKHRIASQVTGEEPYIDGEAPEEEFYLTGELPEFPVAEEVQEAHISDQQASTGFEQEEISMHDLIEKAVADVVKEETEEMFAEKKQPASTDLPGWEEMMVNIAAGGADELRTGTEKPSAEPQVMAFESDGELIIEETVPHEIYETTEEALPGVDEAEAVKEPASEVEETAVNVVISGVTAEQTAILAAVANGIISEPADQVKEEQTVAVADSFEKAKTETVTEEGLLTTETHLKVTKVVSGITTDSVEIISGVVVEEETPTLPVPEMPINEPEQLSQQPEVSEELEKSSEEHEPTVAVMGENAEVAEMQDENVPSSLEASIPKDVQQDSTSVDVQEESTHEVVPTEEILPSEQEELHPRAIISELTADNEEIISGISAEVEGISPAAGVSEEKPEAAPTEPATLEMAEKQEAQKNVEDEITEKTEETNVVLVEEALTEAPQVSSQEVEGTEPHIIWATTFEESKITIIRVTSDNVEVISGIAKPSDEEVCTEETVLPEQPVESVASPEQQEPKFEGTDIKSIIAGIAAENKEILSGVIEQRASDVEEGATEPHGTFDSVPISEVISEKPVETPSEIPAEEPAGPLIKALISALTADNAEIITGITAEGEPSVTAENADKTTIPTPQEAEELEEGPQVVPAFEKEPEVTMPTKEEQEEEPLSPETQLQTVISGITIENEEVISGLAEAADFIPTQEQAEGEQQQTLQEQENIGEAELPVVPDLVSQEIISGVTAEQVEIISGLNENIVDETAAQEPIQPQEEPHGPEDTSQEVEGTKPHIIWATTFEESKITIICITSDNVEIISGIAKPSDEEICTEATVLPEQAQIPETILAEPEVAVEDNIQHLKSEPAEPEVLAVCAGLTADGEKIISAVTSEIGISEVIPAEEIRSAEGVDEGRTAAEAVHVEKAEEALEQKLDLSISEKAEEVSEAGVTGIIHDEAVEDYKNLQPQFEPLENVVHGTLQDAIDTLLEAVVPTETVATTYAAESTEKVAIPDVPQDVEVAPETSQTVQEQEKLPEEIKEAIPTSELEDEKNKVIPPPIMLKTCPCEGPCEGVCGVQKTVEQITIASGEVPNEEETEEKTVTTFDASSPTQFAQNVAKIIEAHPELMEKANIDFGESVNAKMTVTTYTTKTSHAEPGHVIKHEPIVLALEREKRATAPTRQVRSRVYKLLPRDVHFCTNMIEAHGDDYQAMEKDPRNVYKETAKSIQRKIRIFRESPQYETYVHSKENSPVPAE